MRKILSLVSILCATSALFAIENKTFERSVDSNWEHASKQYSPPILANGDIGLLIDYRNCQFHDVSSYKYIKSISEKVYSPSIYRQGRRLDNKKLACFGRFEESVDFENSPDAKPESWSQHLDIFNAISETKNTYNKGKTIIDSSAFVSADMPIIAIQKRFSGDTPKSYTFEYYFCEERKYDEQPMHMRGKIANGEISYKLEGTRTKTKGKIALFCDDKNAKIIEEENSIKITIDKPKGDIAFFVAIVDNFKKNDYNAELAKIKKIMDESPWQTLLDSHKKQWQKFYGDFGITLEDKKVESTYYTAIYNLKCWSTQWSIPVGILRTHWNGSFFGFTFFGPALSASGHLPEVKKLGNFWNSIIPAAKARAGRKDSQVGIRYNWQSLENGAEGTTREGQWLDHILHLGNIPIECYSYYQYTEDKEYLRTKAYPVIRGCAEFFVKQAVYELKDGRTVIGKFCDLERLPSALENASLTTSAAISTLLIASESAEILGVDADYAKNWRKIADALKKHLPRDNEKYIPYPNADQKSVGVLGSTIPYGILGKESDLQVKAIHDFEKNGLAFGNMYKVGSRICSWYASWLSCAMSRIEDGEGAERNIQRAIASVGKFAEIFEINEPAFMSVPWCSSPQGTYIQSVNEMFIQCKGDTIKIIPAITKKWKNYSFKLRAYDSIIVECKCIDGKPTIKLTAENNHSEREKTIIVAGGTPQKIKLSKGETKTL